MTASRFWAWGKRFATSQITEDGDALDIPKVQLVSAAGVDASPPALGPKPAATSMPVVPAGIYATVSFTPIAGAYSINDTMGTAQEFVFTYGDGTAIPTGSLIRILTAILRVDQTALQTAEGAYQLQTYGVTPPSALADNAAWTLSSADLPSHRGPIALGTPVDLGAACYVKTPNVDLDIRLTGVSLFAYLQTLAGLTVAASPAVRQVTLYGIVL